MRKVQINDNVIFFTEGWKLGFHLKLLELTMRMRLHNIDHVIPENRDSHK